MRQAQQPSWQKRTATTAFRVQRRTTRSPVQPPKAENYREEEGEGAGGTAVDADGYRVDEKVGETVEDRGDADADADADADTDSVALRRRDALSENAVSPPPLSMLNRARLSQHRQEHRSSRRPAPLGNLNAIREGASAVVTETGGNFMGGQGTNLDRHTSKPSSRSISTPKGRAVPLMKVEPTQPTSTVRHSDEVRRVGSLLLAFKVKKAKAAKARDKADESEDGKQVEAPLALSPLWERTPSPARPIGPTLAVRMTPPQIERHVDNNTHEEDIDSALRKLGGEVDWWSWS